MSSVLSKPFELSIIHGVQRICKIPPFQFVFQRGLGCFQALRSLCSVLVDYVGKGEILVISAYDITNAFGSLIHSQAMLELIRRWLQLIFSVRCFICIAT